MRNVRLIGTISVALCALLCGCESARNFAASVTTIRSATVLPNANSALSAFVQATIENADSARVKITSTDDTPSISPAVTCQSSSVMIPVLGLRAATSYRMTIEAFGPHTRTDSTSLNFTTGDLPVPLRNARLVGSGVGGPGYTLVTPLAFDGDTVGYALAFDSTGELRWYRAFHEGVPAVEAKQQANGKYTVYLGTSHGAEPVVGRYAEVTPTGEEVRSYSAAAPFYTDAHEMQLVFNAKAEVEHVLLFGYDLRQGDLTGQGGPSSGLVAGHYLLQQSPDGKIEFFWSAWDHFTMSDWIEPYSNVPPVDFDHPNAISLDTDGNFVVSWRQLGEIDKINAKTGALMWRLGGLHNQFQILNDPSGRFAAQHYARILPNGNLLLFDNGTGLTPQESRAVEYQLDFTRKTATMVWEYRHKPSVYSPFVGSAQRLRTGNTLVGFGLVGRIVEVDANSQVVWDAELKFGDRADATWFYRAVRLGSLYRFSSP